MSTPPVAAGAVIPNEFPLRFRAHSFGAHNYNTIGLKLVYKHAYQIEDADDAVAPPPDGPDYRKLWGTLELGIANFPSPVELEWKSLDGVVHKASIDLADVFPDRRILHHVPESEIPEGWAHDVQPEIHVEVNDRTVNIYMISDIATKHEQIPGNRYSNHRQETFLVWTHTY